MRLIDADALIKEMERWDWQELYLPIHFKELLIDEAPTIEPSGDLISREDAIKAVAKLNRYDVDERNRLREYAPWHGTYTRTFIETEAIYRAVNALPSADRPTGVWIDFVSQVEGRFKECDHCGERIYLSTFYENDYNYCPMCGAKMKHE